MEKNLQHRYTQTVTPSHLTDKVISQLFIRMQSNYGHLWTSRWPDNNTFTAAKAEWSNALSCFNTESLSIAIRLCLKRFPMPPSLPEFYLLCREQEPACAAHRMLEISKQPRCTKETADKNLEIIRSMIRGAMSHE